MNTTKKIKKILNYENNNNNNIKSYDKISKINIDSRQRNIDPKNIIKKYISSINNFIFNINSSKLKIMMDLNHGLNINDQITINNINSIKITLRSGSLKLKKNSSNVYINHPNHNLYNNTSIIIDGITNTFINNISITCLNKEYNIIIIDKDNYYININIISNNDYTYNDSININIYTIFGIHIKYINASYPLNFDILQGYHTITESEIDYIVIKLQVNAIDSGIYSFSNNYLIGIIDKNIDGYPTSDFFRFYFNKEFKNIKKIKLLSTEIPYLETHIKDKPSNDKNNSFYFQILDDGNYIYQIKIQTGNYYEKTLQDELIKEINNTKRHFGDYLNNNLYYNYCIADISINPNNNLFSIQIFSLYISSDNINISNEIYDDNFTRLNITHQYHYLNINDQITISGVSNFKDIPDSIINTTHYIESIENLNNYIIKLPKYNTTNNKINSTNNAITIKYPLNIRLLFTYNDTFGDIIGFKNIGCNTSYTDYNKIITNRTLYYNDSNLNSVGNTNDYVSMLNFNNIPYIIMTSNIFCSNINYLDSNCIFAKLFLSNMEGSTIYNRFIQLNENPYNINTINYIEFKFLTPTGKQYYLNNKDYSLTIEIHEEIF